MKKMMAKTPPGPTLPGAWGSTPAQACCERTVKRYAHSSGSALTNETVASELMDSRSQRKANVADLRLESSFLMFTVDILCAVLFLLLPVVFALLTSVLSSSFTVLVELAVVVAASSSSSAYDL